MSQPSQSPFNGHSNPPEQESNSIRITRVEVELRALRDDVAEIKTDIREMRSDVLGALQGKSRVQEKCMSLLGAAGQAILKPSTGLLILLGMLLLGAGLVTVADLGALWEAVGFTGTP